MIRPLNELESSALYTELRCQDLIDSSSPQDWQDDDSTRAVKGIFAGIGLCLPIWVVIAWVVWP